MKRLIWLAVPLFLAGVAFAQEPVTGIPPFSSIESGGFDNINRQNLNVNVSFPIVSVPGRGGSFGFAVVNDSLIWKKVTVGSTTSWTPVTDRSANPTYGWLKEAPVGQTLYSYSTIRCYDYDIRGWEYIDKYSNYSYYDARGARHPFTVLTIVSCLTGGTSVGYATDGSGYKIDITNPTAPRVWNKAGDEMTPNSGYVPDTNGNKISFSVAGSVTTWTDTAGHSALVVDKSNANYIDYKFYDNNGAQQVFRLNLDPTARNIKTNFACSGVVEFTGTQTLPISLVNLVNNQSYQFTYEDTPGFPGYSTGRLKRITLPTGGYVEYQYPTTGNNGINCSDATVTSLTKVVSDGTASTWTFTRTPIGSAWKTVVTPPVLPYDAAANVSTFTFNSSGQITSENHYQGGEAGTLLRTMNTTWATNGTPSSTVIILDDNKQTQTDSTFDSFANLTQSIEYAWGVGAPGAAVRTTQMTYLSTTPYTSRNILNRVAQVRVRDGGVTGTIKSQTDIAYDETGYINATCVTGAAQHDDTNYGCTFVYRGLPTSVSTYTNAAAPSGGVTRHSYYDSLGNLTKADVNCCQQKQWAFSATTQYAFPDSVTSGPLPGPQLTTSATYNAYTGLVASSTDENSKTSYFTYDVLKRLTDVQRPDGQHVTYTYDDTNKTVTTTNPVQATNVVKQIVAYNGLARPIRTTLADSGGASYSIVETQYDPVGRAYKVSNPHNSTAQYWTETRFDGLGRILKTILPDTQQTTYSYSGSQVTATDPTGKQRKSDFDALGRLVTLYEPDVANANQLTQQTSYAYNVLGLLTGVTQGAQSRSFNYDDMGRPTSLTTPEGGTWSYVYNNFSLVTQRTDARGVITTYGYDALNRLTQVSYNVGTTGVPATPTVTLTYGTNSAQNTNGRLLTMTDGVGSETYSYDILGRATQVQKVISGTTYTTGYGYNSASELASITYPSGRVVQQSFDTIGRLSTIASGTTNYASAFVYNPAFQPTALSYGNGVNASFGYSADRLQLTSLSYTKSPTTLFSLTYGYAQGGVNNGQITSISDTVDSGRTVNYTYDALYRLKTALTNGSVNYPQWGLSWTYDRYGNRTAQTVTAGTGPSNAVTVDPATNRITGAPYSYDANGNMTNDGLNALAYDAENRLVTSSGSTYSYDGKSLRVQKVSGGTTAVYIFSGAKVVAEYVNGAAPAAPTREYIYSGSALVATIAGSTTTYHHADHLSVRLTTDTSGNALAQQGHYPFGESWYQGSGGTKWQFTSYERDTESGNDYAMFRYHVNRLGRFSSPDPIAGSVADPQSLNRYAYVRNDAVNLADPLGLVMTWWDWGGGGGFWDALRAGFVPSFDERGNMRWYPGDWGSARYSGSEVFQPGLGDWYSSGDRRARDRLQAVLSAPGPSGEPGGEPPGGDPRETQQPQKHCKNPNFVQRALIGALTLLASLTGKTLGVGLGGSAGLGPSPATAFVPGPGVTGSVQIVVSPSGQAAVEKSYSVGAAVGAGATGGIAISVSNARSPQDLAGPFGQLSGGAGRGWGVGGDVAWSNRTWQGTLTVGGGLGGFGAASTTQQTVVQPFCR